METSSHKNTDSELNKDTSRKSVLIWGGLALSILILGSSIYYFGVVRTRIYIEKSEINAPSISLAPTTSGVLKEVYVVEGESVTPHQPVARIGDELVKTEVAGVITSVANSVGQQFKSGQTVVTMIDPSELRVVGHLDEDKGLEEIAVGNRVVFTVDAFSGKEYEGVVDMISPVSRTNDVVFSISDKREVKQFDVKVLFDQNAYSYFKNGMSARMWIYKQ